MVVEGFVANGYAAMVSWTYILLMILLVVKIIQFFTGGGNWSWPGSSRSRDSSGSGNRGDREINENIGPPHRKGNKPNKVLVFRGVHGGDNVRLSWAANPSDERINYYHIERQRHARTPKGFGWNRNLWGNWRRVAYVSRNFTPEDPFIDNERFRNHEGIIKEWWNSLDPIIPENDYKYRIRAVNSHGKGPWTTIRVSRPLHAHGWVPVIDNVNEEEGGTGQGHVEERRL